VRRLVVGKLDHQAFKRDAMVFKHELRARSALVANERLPRGGRNAGERGVTTDLHPRRVGEPAATAFDRFRFCADVLA